MPERGENIILGISREMLMVKIGSIQLLTRSYEYIVSLTLGYLTGLKIYFSSLLFYEIFTR